MTTITKELVDEVIQASQSFIESEKDTGGKADLQLWLDVVCPELTLKMARMLLASMGYAHEPLTRPEHPIISSEELDDETLDELIGFRRNTLEYHSEQGNKVQTILHGVTLKAMLELKERRAAMLQSEPVSNRDELPPGWVMVPKEPTAEMRIVGIEAATAAMSVEGECPAVHCYKSMIAAAPQQGSSNG